MTKVQDVLYQCDYCGDKTSRIVKMVFTADWRDRSVHFHGIRCDLCINCYSDMDRNAFFRWVRKVLGKKKAVKLE